MGFPLASLTIKPASPIQTRIAHELTWLEWHRGRTKDQYVQQSEELAKPHYVTEEKFATWGLVPWGDLETEDILASCETMRWQVAAIGFSENNGVDTVAGHSIACVFVRPEYRRSGYAGHMMRLLHHALAPPPLLPPFPTQWGERPPRQSYGQDAVVSVLYTDVGTFYEGLGPVPDSKGWMVTNKKTTIWSASAADLPADLEWLGEEDLSVLDEDDAAILNELFDPAVDTKRWTFLPGDNLIPYQAEWSKAEWGNDKPKYPGIWPPTIWGVKLCQPSLAFARWTYELRPSPSRLDISRIRAPDEESFRAIINAARFTAKEVGVEVVELWNVSPKFDQASLDLKGEISERMDRWPCVAWYGLKKPRDETEVVEWVNNEKFSCC